MAQITITPGQIVRRALLLIGAVDRDKSLTGAELNDGMDSMNAMLSSWSANKLKIPSITKESFTLVVGQGSYTIGESAADWNTVRPHDVLSVYIRSGDNVDFPVEKVGRGKWNDVIAKGTSARPYLFYYHPETVNGTLYFDSTPETAETVFIDSQKDLGNFTVSTTAITLPTTYHELIPYQLAIRLAPEYGLSPSVEVYNIATSTMTDVMALNSEPFEAELDFALVYRAG